ncbi:MAG: hypothetical protein ACE5GB_03140, partial [Acidimicrobiales bacterium]
LDRSREGGSAEPHDARVLHGGADLADQILPLGEIAEAVIKLFAARAPKRPTSPPGTATPTTARLAV